MDQQGNLLGLLTPVLTSLNSNMSAMGESLKRLNNVGQRNDTRAAPAAKKPRLLPESGISIEVNDLLGDGQLPQDKQSENQEDGLDDIAQSLDETERTAEPVSEKLAKVADKSWLHKA